MRDLFDHILHDYSVIDARIRSVHLDVVVAGNCRELNRLIRRRLESFVLCGEKTAQEQVKRVTQGPDA